ncbi:MAG: hypothetical protein EAZ42_12035 [Verrucomicrobia bacterium]|nr:MAG: hypothetical protein EAZ42_12035 [Verrucomicrobiota bacterium]
MKIAIIHYHLRPGGVTRVIEATSQLMTRAGIEHLVLCAASGGEPPRDIPIAWIDALGYGEELDAKSCLQQFLTACEQHFGGPPDIWHFHNPTLGKNQIVPNIIDQLANAGARIVMQIHDVAEDGRPHQYAQLSSKKILYPLSSRIHYRFINPRDHAHFLAAGLPAQHTSVGINPIMMDACDDAIHLGYPFVFAPIRGIRRKNLGELLLLASLALPPCVFATSRAPQNLLDLAHHDRWAQFAKRQNIPIEFNVVDRFAPQAGAGSGFHDWLQHATHLVSTSVAEGFGLPFAEAALWGIPLIARDLPHLRDQLKHAGLEHAAASIYQEIRIPAGWIDLALLESALISTIERNDRAYGTHHTPKQCDEILANLTKNNSIEFSNLPEAFQQSVLERLSDPASRDVPHVLVQGHWRPLRQWLEEVLSTPSQRMPNRILGEQLNAAHWQEMHDIYQTLMNSRLDRKVQGAWASRPQPFEAIVGETPTLLEKNELEPIQYLPSERVLARYQTIDSFHFLKSAAPPERKRAACKAVIFDVYGTLISSATYGVKHDPLQDPVLRDVLRHAGIEPPDSPSKLLENAVLAHHQSSPEPFPEVDLRVLWRKILTLPENILIDNLVEKLENAWHPVTWTDGAAALLRRLSRDGILLGLLSNAQCNTLPSLGDCAALFDPDLSIFSYQFGIAKPDARLFLLMKQCLEDRAIQPHEVVFIGNDPEHDIVPAKAVGFRTVLYRGSAKSSMAGEGAANKIIDRWDDLYDWL